MATSNIKINRVDQEGERQAILAQIGRAMAVAVQDGIVTVAAPTGAATMVVVDEVVTFTWRPHGSAMTYEFWMEKGAVRDLGETLRRLRQRLTPARVA